MYVAATSKLQWLRHWWIPRPPIRASPSKWPTSFSWDTPPTLCVKAWWQAAAPHCLVSAASLSLSLSCSTSLRLVSFFNATTPPPLLRRTTRMLLFFFLIPSLQTFEFLSSVISKKGYPNDNFYYTRLTFEELKSRWGILKINRRSDVKAREGLLEHSAGSIWNFLLLFLVDECMIFWEIFNVYCLMKI